LLVVIAPALSTYKHTHTPIVADPASQDMVRRMSVWKPKPVDNLRWDALQLSGEEGLVLSRLDGSTPATQLTYVTGMPPTRVAEILDRLVTLGAVGAMPGAAPAPPTAAAEPSHGDDVHSEALAALIEADLADDAPSEMMIDDADASAEEEEDESAPAKQSDRDDGDDVDNNGNDDIDEHEENNYRKLYHSEFAGLEAGAREAAARTSQGARLLALCFDPLPNVVHAAIDNPSAGFPVGRLIARHHRTPQGLDAVMTRAEYVRDAQVQRFVLQNPMAQDPHMKRILQPKRLPMIYQYAIHRDVPERNRSKIKLVLRSKWQSCAAEDRADVVLRTEGRVLNLLIGLTFDSHTTALLCQRTITSVMMVQNLCRFSATPPPLLMHLMRQNTVKRSPQLRQMVMRHPNTPSEAKRNA
jgi:hypothetical protein